MNDFITKLRNEPAVVVSTVAALLLLFGVKLSQENADAITQILVAVVPLIAGVVVRQQVTPAARADARVEQAYVELQVEDHPGNPFRGA